MLEGRVVLVVIDDSCLCKHASELTVIKRFSKKRLLLKEVLRASIFDVHSFFS